LPVISGAIHAGLSPPELASGLRVLGTMWPKRIIASLALGLSVAACAPPNEAQDTRIFYTYSDRWAGAPIFPLEPKRVDLTILSPPLPWGPVTIVSSDGSAVRLSQEGVSTEATGSSTPPPDSTPPPEQ
jgi:hypothetical protein